MGCRCGLQIEVHTIASKNFAIFRSDWGTNPGGGRPGSRVFGFPLRISKAALEGQAARR
jgi:hypothetical protein